MAIFYQENIDELKLSETEAHHAVKVLRKKVGDKIQLVTGKGILVDAEITATDKKNCEYKIIQSTQFEEPTPKIHIAIAPTKNMDRYEWFAEKAVEIGVSEITPILTENSERKKLKLDRLQNILVSGMKQSKNYFLPKLNELTSFPDFIKSVRETQKYIAHCETEESQHLIKLINTNQDILIMIGPEGDFSNNEIQLAVKSGFKECSLGNSRLRTETAGVVACEICNLAKLI